jgi:hypothetical protein
MSKILVNKENDIAVLHFSDSVDVTVNSNNVVAGAPHNNTITNFNSSNATLYTDVTLPDDFMDGRYKYDGSNFTANSDWQNPISSMLVQDQSRYSSDDIISDEFKTALQTEIDRLNAL